MLTKQPAGGQLSTVDSQQALLRQGKGIPKVREGTFEHLADYLLFFKRTADLLSEDKCIHILKELLSFTSCNYRILK